MKKNLLFGLAFLSFIVWSFFSVYSEVFSPYVYQTPTRLLEAVSPAVVGELVRDVEVEQNFYIDDSIKKKFLKYKNTNIVCLNLFMANYVNRINKGTVGVNLKTPVVDFYETFEMSTVQDNRFHKVCFDKMKVLDIVEGNYTLKIIGIDGKLGESATIWMSKDTNGMAVSVDEKLLNDYRLRYYISVKKTDDVKLYTAWSLFLIYTLMFMMLFIAVYQENSIKVEK